MHRSYLNESPGFELPSNERLEFLGDSVLGFVVAEHLYRHFPKAEEGRLTEMRVSLIRTATLAQAARALGLGQHLLMGRGEETSGGRSRPSILEAAFEAILGAIFLDQGIDVARAFVLGRLRANLSELERGPGPKDAKSAMEP
ncbi:MAG: ribonuclease III, partial [Bacteroidetes bacterium]|nr:ribonuclease III [Bacteroidota bacterium]